MKLKDIKRLKWLRKNPTITLNGHPVNIELKQDQDGNWTINFIEASRDSKDLKDS